jgi:EPS-associated MarR family transcriptional regulator
MEQHLARLLIVTRHGGSVSKAHHCEQSEAIHMTSRRSLLQEDTYFRVLRMLQDNPDMTQREIAEKLGISTSGLNYCLKALIDKGWVKVQNFSQSKNKFGYIYVLTPQGVAEKAVLTGRFLKRKMAEYDSLKAEIDALRAEADVPFDCVKTAP